ncbi:GatB/YqeY domain-containing protein [Pediococcus argentinicus]|uniref:GatB YqeY domain-containing protein n=1 Tax=Pediococcus argentinicus TaxID=480391 RepID=A0A0R2NQT0_9LACO|nr:GatB/YqeY domain-containing protein [Pediococcus argentinicus]KRO26259.1 GatB YqeY domain-containing protein [Pediococcus argentinicus]NKZ21549.1 GatB/YqeY domain-containing protein [Pediococcus argentinicus]GEP18652.1 hypothetical protein LSA03_00360 [Pediococcus argentinicus]
MNVQDQIVADMKTAMKAHDKLTLNVVRMIKADLMNEKVKVGHDLTDEEVNTVVLRANKQRKESLEEFKKGNRDDLVQETEAELKVVAKYMPQQLSDDEVKQIVSDTIKEVGATSKADFGKVMGALMPKIKGKADGGKVNQLVKENLS